MLHLSFRVCCPVRVVWFKFVCRLSYLSSTRVSTPLNVPAVITPWPLMVSFRTEMQPMLVWVLGFVQAPCPDRPGSSRYCSWRVWWKYEYRTSSDSRLPSVGRHCSDPVR